MLIILSPAKIQDFSKQYVIDKYTLPAFLKEAEIIINELRTFSSPELAKLLKINNEIARINSDRHFNWHTPFTTDNAKQSVLVFHGEVFHGLDAISFDKDDFEFAQDNMRILSGLYGVLRPLDLIQPYRIDIGDSFKFKNGMNLYAFWKDKITLNIANAAEASDNIILNLASNEYYKALEVKKLSSNIIDVDFLETNRDGYKNVTIYTKKARGLMARYIIKNKIKDIEDLKGFDYDGYWFNSNLSSDKKLVFVR